MRVLVTWGSKRGGTAGIGQTIAATLQARGFDVVATAAESAPRVAGFDAVIVGAGLYANRWVPSARRFVHRNVNALRERPVWMFSSGPLDDSADRAEIPPPPAVEVLGERIGAKGHRTFGGMLRPDATGFPASSMAKDHAGDFRNPTRIRAWADELAAALPSARPGVAIDHPGRSILRLLAPGAIGWAVCASTMGSMLALGNRTAAFIVHAIVAPLVFIALARLYFRVRGARDPLPTALVWTAEIIALDLAVVAGAYFRNLDMFTSFVGTWLPLALVFVATWATGGIMSTMPWAKPGTTADAR